MSDDMNDFQSRITRRILRRVEELEAELAAGAPRYPDQELVIADLRSLIDRGNRVATVATRFAGATLH